MTESIEKKKRAGRGSYFVNTQSAKRQRFAGLCVNQQDFSVQNHAVAAREGLRDVLFEMGHLKCKTFIILLLNIWEKTFPHLVGFK